MHAGSPASAGEPGKNPRRHSFEGAFQQTPMLLEHTANVILTRSMIITITVLFIEFFVELLTIDNLVEPRTLLPVVIGPWGPLARGRRPNDADVAGGPFYRDWRTKLRVAESLVYYQIEESTGARPERPSRMPALRGIA